MICKSLQAAYDHFLLDGYGLDAFISDIYPFIRDNVRAMLPTKYRDQADDVVQVIAYEVSRQVTAPGGGAGIANFEAWLRTLCKYRCVDATRHQVSVDAHCDTIEPDELLNVSLTSAALPMPTSLTDREQSLAELISEGYTEREIADLYHTSKSTIHRSLQTLRAKYAA